MNSLPQEVIDEIIDCLPYPSLTSSSLVATRWRKKSQQLLFDTTWFHSERRVKLWHAYPKADQGRISSYVHFAGFDRVCCWDDPTLFVRLLKSFSSLRVLWMNSTEIPSELLGHISRGEFGKGITTLSLWSPHCAFSTIASIIVSLPDLKKLAVQLLGTKSGDPSSAHPISPLRRRLNVLKLYGSAGGVASVLIQSQFTFRYLRPEIDTPGLQQLLTLSSETLEGIRFEDTQAEDASPPIDLPPFPALTFLRVGLRVNRPSHHFLNILSSMSSTPALNSIAIDWKWRTVGESVALDAWTNTDKCLARIAKRAKANGGLKLTLKGWPSGKVVWERLLPEFMEAGGEVTTDPYALEDCD